MRADLPLPASPSPGGSIATSGLTARATPTQATVVMAGRNKTIRANVFGTQTHWVWGHKKRGRGPWQPWLGTGWKPEDLYGFGPALTDVVDRYAVREYADAYVDALKAGAFPNG